MKTRTDGINAVATGVFNIQVDIVGTFVKEHGYLAVG